MRTLTLRKETLAPLTVEDLRVVAGASGPCVSDGCLTQVVVCYTDPCLTPSNDWLPTGGCA